MGEVLRPNPDQVGWHGTTDAEEIEMKRMIDDVDGAVLPNGWTISVNLPITYHPPFGGVMFTNMGCLLEDNRDFETLCFELGERAAKLMALEKSKLLVEKFIRTGQYVTREEALRTLMGEDLLPTTPPQK